MPTVEEIEGLAKDFFKMWSELQTAGKVVKIPNAEYLEIFVAAGFSKDQIEI